MTSHRWDSDFDFYMARMDDAPLVIMLDLAAASHAPVASHPRRLQVRVAMQHPRPDGLRSGEEAETLFALEDSLVTAITQERDAVFVGRFVTQGTTTFAFYLPIRDDTERPLDGIEAQAPYELEWFTEEDPQWQFYFEFMRPDAYQLQEIMNRRLLKVREEHGDRQEAVREIDHLVYFPDREKLKQAANALEKLGYRCDEASPPSEDRTQWGLQFHRDDALDGGQADRITGEILDVILPLGGYYDGWGAVIVTHEGRA